ncbi:hypothetical protein HID58_080275 [Brassica napus]|uniref:Uncharacterized protein n=1 Tax=Brassica napus TaxID=3708 RepID=A0ABQ7Y4F9_BRANA|nr:hypothetical protein HID58_080275 [Brassica napus]
MEDHQNLLLGEGSARRPSNTLSPAIQQAVERTPSTLRLGSSLAQDRRSNPPRAVKKKAPQAKQPPKRKTIAKVTGVTRSRGNKSPIQGARASKQLAAKARPAARKRLCVEENKSPRLDMNEIAGVLQDIQFLATLFCPLSFIYIRRLEDSQADSLAKSSISRFINVV